MKVRIDWQRRWEVEGWPMQLLVLTADGTAPHAISVPVVADATGAVDWEQFSSMVGELTNALARLKERME